MNLFGELQRRNVIRMAGLYLVGAWLTVQIASTVFPAFELPGWAVRAVILVLAVAFVPTMMFAWVFEITPEGIRRESELPADRPPAPQTARRMDRMIVLGLVAVIALMAIERVWFAKRDAAAPTTTVAAAAGPIDAIAVLPFRNDSAGGDSDYLSDGISESLIYRLAQIRELTVSPVSSVLQFKGASVDHLEAGRKLGVEAVVAGRLVQRGAGLDISVELIDVRSNRLLWGEQYQRKVSDLLRTQRDIAAEIADRLQLRLTTDDARRFGKHYTSNNEAYRLYLQGRFHWNRRTDASIRKAIEYFKQAGDADPEFALAFTGLSDCYAVLPYYRSMRSSEALEQAAPFAARALAIDDELAEAHASTAYVHQGRWQFADAERSFQRAIELNPRYATAQFWYARLESRLGRSDAALARARAALELEPLSRVIAENLSQLLLERGEVDAALTEAKRLVELDPEFPAGYMRVAQAYLRQGKAPEALAAAEQGIARADQSRLQMARASALVALGRGDEARAFVDGIEAAYGRGEADPAEVAGAWASVGDADRAFEWLQRALAERSMLLFDIRVEPQFHALRDDRRFAALLAAMGVPE